ncbi:ATP-binding cassette domain-containing protein, partial [Marichromatium gracile]|uniref:cell division ATP-binding protein FtsE n=1 Tax=Marichromatium gracile TaxID=1048 RepID=UPI001F3323A3
MIEFDHVHKRYPERGEALSDISFALAAGEMAFLTGHSGAGKSTLLRLIGLLERPSRGRVVVDGRDLGALPRRQIPLHRRQVGMIFQDHRLLADRSVFDNVALPLQVMGYGQREIGRRVRAALDHVGLLKRERATPVALSGGGGAPGGGGPPGGGPPPPPGGAPGGAPPPPPPPGRAPPRA